MSLPVPLLVRLVSGLGRLTGSVGIAGRDAADVVAARSRQPSRLVRAAGALYPVGVAAVTIATANHFWLDAMGGMMVVALSGAVALGRHRVPRVGRVAPSAPG